VPLEKGKRKGAEKICEPSGSCGRRDLAEESRDGEKLKTTRGKKVETTASHQGRSANENYQEGGS